MKHRVRERFMKAVSWNQFKSVRIIGAAGLSVEVFHPAKHDYVELYDGSACTTARHVEEHQRIANPVTTDSEGWITVCIAEGVYDVVVSGTGIETVKLTLDEQGNLHEAKKPA